LKWYLKHRRDLPWRRTRDPYAIWVSEVMLQQTRVETVIPYYDRFLGRFPTVASLAGAKESDVLAAWSGLGYYRRAKNLRDASILLVREHDARIPDDSAALRRLPGVGDYTAAAIESVAFGRAAAAVDGNVVRVLARIHGWKGRRSHAALRRRVAATAQALASGPRPGDWTQALMELGATVCLPREPRCPSCPARLRCVARQSGRPDRYPEPAPSTTPKRGFRVMLLARRKGSILLAPDAAGQGGGWALPTARTTGRGGAKAAAALARRYRLAAKPNGPAARFRHRTFSDDLQFEVWVADDEGSAPTGRPALWVDPRHFERLPLRAPTLKAIKGLRAKE
jgi:A/G-specific adenine glycosylase